MNSESREKIPENPETGQIFVLTSSECEIEGGDEATNSKEILCLGFNDWGTSPYP